jgi:dTDP-4-dehydrorhamnose 3,5-epimerase
MQAMRLSIPDVILFTPRVFGDARGFFFESFNQSTFEALSGLSCAFVQDNHSKSQAGVLRGLHYQLSPKAQGKLVRVVQGEVFDVAVDIRQHSATFGQWVGVRLSSESNHQLWIPEGFAHGFLTLSETAEFLYKTTNFYDPAYERCIAWNDVDLNIQWPLEQEPVLSGKDQQGLAFRLAELFD